MVNAQDCVLGGFVVQKNVAPDLTTIVPKNSVPYAYLFSRVVSAPMADPVSAFTPADPYFNTSFGPPTGINRLVPGAVRDRNPWDPPTPSADN